MTSLLILGKWQNGWAIEDGRKGKEKKLAAAVSDRCDDIRQLEASNAAEELAFLGARKVKRQKARRGRGREGQAGSRCAPFSLRGMTAKQQQRTGE